jgi:hypothetical protein
MACQSRRQSGCDQREPDSPQCQRLHAPLSGLRPGDGQVTGGREPDQEEPEQEPGRARLHVTNSAATRGLTIFPIALRGSASTQRSSFGSL